MDYIRISETERKTNPSAMLRFKEQRNEKLSEADWLINRCSDKIVLGQAEQSELTELIAYRQSLRDMPDIEGFDPANPQWPTMPA